MGTEGRLPEQLSQEVHQGACFVIYSYNFSLLVVSFKRPSSIHYIPPGGNRIVRGLPFTLISLVFGWWGIPWGIIYTFQTLATNLGGGTDVTDEVMKALLPPPASVLAPGTSTSTPTRPPARRRVSWRQYVPAVGVVVALVSLTFTIISLWMGTHLTTALVSGVEKPYTVDIDGHTYRADSRAPLMLTLAEGSIHVRGAPGTTGEQIVEATSGFWSRPFDRHVLVLNPDRLALVARQTVQYHPHGSADTGKDDSSIALQVNQPGYFLPEPDYFFADFPATISMPSGTASLAKSRLTAIPTKTMSLQARAAFLREQLGYGAVKDYLTNYSRIAPDEQVQELLYTTLKREDARPLFEARLGERPVDVEWHRAYQSFMEAKYPNEDLTPRYRQLAAANPDDGALIYLYARLVPDPNQSRPLYEKALHASHPAPYAAYALGVDEFGAGRYEAALKYIDEAEAGGVHSDSLHTRKRDLLLALNRTDELLAAARKDAARDHTDLGAVADELTLLAAFAPDEALQRREIAEYVKQARVKWSEKDAKLGESYLAAQIAYAKGREVESAKLFQGMEGAAYQLECAVDERDVTAAEKAIAKTEDQGGYLHFVLTLAAHAAGDAAAEENHYRAGIASLGESWRENREVSKMLSGKTEIDHARILRLPDYATRLRVLFTVLGLRYPEQRARYFERATSLNHDPNFPHLLVKAVLEKP